MINRISSNYFAGKDLSETMLSNADLRYADLRGTLLKETRLIGADLISAKFFRKDLLLSEITNAQVSLYILKMGQTGKNGTKDLFHEVIELLPNEELVLYPNSSFRDDLVWEMSIGVEDIQHLELSRETLATGLSTKVAIYYDECEELARMQDSAKPRRKPKPLR